MYRDRSSNAASMALWYVCTITEHLSDGTVKPWDGPRALNTYSNNIQIVHFTILYVVWHILGSLTYLVVGPQRVNEPLVHQWISSSNVAWQHTVDSTCSTLICKHQATVHAWLTVISLSTRLLLLIKHGLTVRFLFVEQDFHSCKQLYSCVMR